MSTISLRGGAREASISAVVIDANGKVKKDLGVVAYYHRNPLKRAWWYLKKEVKSWLQ